jgi:4-deoxy-L-threo-5-hexosulose-uronate ketol-isomerase
MSRTRLRHETHPDDVDRLDTAGLRERFLVDGLVPPEPGIGFAFIGYDRLVVAGIRCGDDPVDLAAPPELAAEYFCENREFVVVGIGGDAEVDVDGERFALRPHDVLYVGRGSRRIRFSGPGARLFLASAPAHRDYPTRLVPLEQSIPRELGSAAESTERTVRQYVVPGLVDACQLTAGITTLGLGSVWNTLPSHLHPRRTELYFYFGMDEGGRVLHHCGPPDRSRSLVVADEELVIAPPWSIHTGVGTQAYSFVWVMAGENREYSDLEPVPIAAWR